MAEPIKTSISLTFAKTPDDEIPDFVVELDDDANNNVTEFTIGDGAFVRVMHGEYEDYRIDSSSGKLNKSASNYPYAISESLSFALDTEKTLAYYPNYKGASFVWVGKAPKQEQHPSKDVNVNIVGKAVTLSEPAVGVLLCTYVALGDRWRVSDIVDEGDVVVVALPTEGSSPASCTIPWVAAVAVTPSAHLYDLKVIDYCTDDPLEGVNVTIDGQAYGQTDENGLIYVGNLPVGTLPLVMTKTGYINSVNDKLNNDAIEIAGST